ncbi:MAG: hypothetical protein HONDAALG_01712 [Gammaproteobacteria bacterium]|nr:hypothetical protein [Gammaproteobacteria bacterium]
MLRACRAPALAILQARLLLADDQGHRLQRLQKVLDVVRHPRPGLVDCLQMRLPRELLLALLGDVEVPQQLHQQPAVQQQRRAGFALHVKAHRDPGGVQIHGVARALAGQALALLGLPLHAAHPRQPDQRAHRRREELRGRALLVGDVGQVREPLLERRADVQQRPLPEGRQPARARPGGEQPADREQEGAQCQGGRYQGVGVIGVVTIHGDDAAERNQRRHQRGRHPAEEIHGVRAAHSRRPRRHDGDHQRQREQSVEENRDDGLRHAARGEQQRHHDDQQLGDEEQQRQHVDDAFGLRGERAAADQSDDEDQPAGQQPAVQQHDEARGEGHEHGRVHDVEPAISPPDGLPQHEQAQMNQHQGA